VVFLVQLNEFEGGTSAITLLFGEAVPLVETALAVLEKGLTEDQK